MDWGLGDPGQARIFCRKCGEVEYCAYPDGRPRYPEATRKKFRKRHRACDGEVEYMAGVGASLRRMIERGER